MTEQEQRMAIAEACGYTGILFDYPNGHTTVKEWMHDKGVGLPDFLNDLNAMHEAEKVLTPQQEMKYVDCLGGLIMSDAYEGDPRWVKSELSSSDSTYRATAAQRAKAFCRVKWPEKWKK